MLDTAQQEKLNRLKRQLEDLKNQRRRAKKRIEDLGNVLDKVSEKYRQIEEGLQHSYNLVTQRLDRLPQRCKFRLRYAETVKSKLFDSNALESLSEMQQASQAGKSRLLNMEDEVVRLEGKIRETEEQIRILSQKISEGESK